MPDITRPSAATCLLATWHRNSETMLIHTSMPGVAWTSARTFTPIRLPSVG
jgi:hypothetical protein